MKTNLSSQITLTRIPLRYYRPENAFEHSVLTRLEKIPTEIYESAEGGSFAIAKELATKIRLKQLAGETFVLALPGGRSPLSVYRELIRTMVQKAEVPLADTIRMISETPARIMGVDDRKGTLQRGKDADLMVLDKDLNVRAVWAMGKLVEGTNKLF